MKNTYQKYLKKRLIRLFHSWWLAVAFLLILVIGIGVIQRRPNAGNDASKPVIGSNESTGNMPHVYGVALADGLYNADMNERFSTLGRIKKAGFTEVRMGLSWHDVESKQGQYNWVHLDNMMKAVKKTGLTPILLANTTPQWDRLEECKTSDSCPPRNNEDYAKFMASAVSRYKDYKVSAWEVWNEENGNNFWKPQPNPEQYASLLKTTYTAIKKADPSATVLIGGLSGDSVDLIGPNLIDPRTYLKKLYAAGIHNYFDGLAYHPYVGVATITKKGEYNGWEKMNVRDNNLRNTMINNGDEGKKIWITEFGTPTGGTGPVVTDPNNPTLKADHVTLEAQAEIAKDAIKSMNNSSWIRSIDWWTFEDGETASTNTGAAYGIWQYGGKPKPILEVIQNGMQSKSNVSND